MARSKSGKKRRRTQIRQRQRRREKRRKERARSRGDGPGPPEPRVYFSELSESTHPDNRCPYCGQKTRHISETVRTIDKGDQRLSRCGNGNCSRLFKPYVEKVYYANLAPAGYRDSCPYCRNARDNHAVYVTTQDEGRQQLTRCGNSDCNRLFKPRSRR